MNFRGRSISYRLVNTEFYFRIVSHEIPGAFLWGDLDKDH